MGEKVFLLRDDKMTWHFLVISGLFTFDPITLDAQWSEKVTRGKNINFKFFISILNWDF
jgi:hypothetical protein